MHIGQTLKKYFVNFVIFILFQCLKLQFLRFSIVCKMSRRITRSQTICLAKPSEYIVSQNRRKSEPRKKVEAPLTPSTRSSRRSVLNVETNTSTTVLKEIGNVIKVKPNIRKAKVIEAVDNTQKVSTAKSSPTTLSTRVANASFTSNSKEASQKKVKVAPLRRMSVLIEKIKVTTEKSLTTTSSKVDAEITSTVVSHKKLNALEETLEVTAIEPSGTTSSAGGDEINRQDHSFTLNSTVFPEKKVVKKALRSAPLETPPVSVHKTPEVITNDPNPKTSSSVELEIQHDDASSNLNFPVVSDKNVKAARKSFEFKTPSIPLRRSERISVNKGSTSTPVRLQISTLIQPTKIKGRRCTVHSFRTEDPHVIGNNTASIKMNSTIITSAAPKAVSPKNDENVGKHPAAIIKRRTLMTAPARKSAPKKDENVKNNTAAIIMNNTTTLQINGARVEVDNAIKIPEDLKMVLLHDSQIVNGQKKLYNIPANLNVEKVIDDYTATKCLDDAHSSGITIEKVFSSVIEYFEVLIGKQLLYELENVQYEEILHKFPGVAMSKVYPPVYLLRLLIRLNKLLPYSKADSGSLQWIINQLNYFAKYLSEHKSVLFDLSSLC